MCCSLFAPFGADVLRRSLNDASITKSAGMPELSEFSSASATPGQAAASHSIARPMNSNQVFNRYVLISILLSVWLIPRVARGQLYWDLPAGGLWDTTSANWSASAGCGLPTTWLPGSNAIFSAANLATGNFTVTLATNVAVGDLTYATGSLGSTLQIAAGGGNTITIANPLMSVTVGFGTTLIVAPSIAGPGGLVLQNGIFSTLILTGASTYSGGTTISAGTLQLGNGSATGSIVGAVVNNDTFNIVNANTAGITTITNVFGTTNFSNTSTAGNAAITNNGGFTAFFNTSTAGAAAITNNGGFTEFFDTSMAGNATIIINDGGFTEFFDTSTAGNAALTINSGGEAEFNNTSTAGNATITNFASGQTNFNNTSTAGNATVSNSGSGQTNFNNTSTAGNATITNFAGGLTNFNNTSTAGNAAITNNGGITNFNNTSTAGNAAIANNVEITILGSARMASPAIPNNNDGITNFNNTSTAGNAAITNNGGFTNFNNASTAGNAAVTNNAGGETEFFNASTTGNATITTNSGGLTLFFDTSTGGSARFITNAGGIFDMSNLTSGGMAAGSIEGAGTYQLGSKALTVGLNNLSTVVGGTIADGGFNGGAGGSLIKVGTGTLTLTGPNTYSGGTSFNGGIVAVNSDANLGTGGLSFNGGTLQALAAGGGIISSKAITLNALGGTFLADAGATSTLSGAISGVGSLTKDGVGTLALTGANTYTGGTVLNAGTLTVNGAHALGLGNVVVNGGTLNADPQPINVTGNYTQTAGGTLQLQVAGAHAGQYDSLRVGGNAALGGTLQLISLGFQPKAGDQLTLVTTGGVVSGRFAQLVDPFAAPGFTLVGLIYGMNSVLLEFRNLASFALTVNQLAGANLIDAVHLDPRAANLVSFLAQEPFRNLPGDFEKISPDGLTALYEIGFSNANIQRLNLEGRLDDIRDGSNGFTSNMTVNGATVNRDHKADADGKSSKGVLEPVLQPGPENRWGVWVTGFGDFVNVDGDGNAQGYSFTTGGVSLGVDYRITDQLAIGVMGDYSHTWTSLNPSGHIDVDSGRGGLYATWYNHGFYLDGAIYGGHNNYDSSRSGLGGLVTGGTEGAEWSTFISGGYDFHFGPLTVGPIAALQYTYVDIDGFSENGSLAPLAIHSGSAESLRSDVGFRAFYQWQIGKIVLEPSLRTAWEHEYKYSALPITAGFAEIPGPSATFFGPSEGHDSAVVSAGVSVRLTPAITTYVNYDGQLGRDNYDSNAVTGGFRITF